MNCRSELSNSSPDPDEEKIDDYEQCIKNYYLKGEKSPEVCLDSSNINKNVDLKVLKKFEDCIKNETKPEWTTSQIVWTVIGVLFLLLIISSAINQYQDDKQTIYSTPQFSNLLNKLHEENHNHNPQEASMRVCINARKHNHQKKNKLIFNSFI
jgi:hypothetical protein